jgi:tRNA threonylcarbamoyladenosine biosynthesis protein TsaB
VIGEVFLRVERQHTEVLIPAIEALFSLTETNIDAVDLLACTKGPGSFTGVRIGISTLKGLALAEKKPIVGVSTLKTLAMNLGFSKNLICTILDAQKSQVYSGSYRIGDNGLPEQTTDDRLLDIETLIRELPQESIDFIGDGAIRYQDKIREGFSPANIFTSNRMSNPTASSLGIIAYDCYKKGFVSDAPTLMPVYFRLSEAELKNRLHLID